MRQWVIFFGAVSLTMGGCHKNDQKETALMEATVSNRPMVALTPVLDHSRSHLNWSLSQELSLALRQRLTQKNHLYLVGEISIANAQKYLASKDPFELDTSWIKKAFPEQEFVVFTELMEHRENPINSLKDGQDVPAELRLAVRVRVFDIREKTPKIILQEIIEQSHHIPRQFTQAHFHQVPWGDETFDVSPLGIAHANLCKEVASRVEDYILSASR